MPALKFLTCPETGPGLVSIRPRDGYGSFFGQRRSTGVEILGSKLGSRTPICAFTEWLINQLRERQL